MDRLVRGICLGALLTFAGGVQAVDVGVEFDGRDLMVDLRKAVGTCRSKVTIELVDVNGDVRASARGKTPTIRLELPKDLQLYEFDRVRWSLDQPCEGVENWGADTLALAAPRFFKLIIQSPRVLEGASAVPLRVHAINPLSWLPVKGVEISLNGEYAVTDEFGVAHLKSRLGTVEGRLGPMLSKVAIGPAWEVEQRLTIASDRPLYQAGETVHLRLWLRSLRGVAMQPQKVRVWLTLPPRRSTEGRHFRSSEPEELELQIDEWGLASTTFVLPENLQTGSISIRARAESAGAELNLGMIESRLPEFAVLIETWPRWIPSESGGIAIIRVLENSGEPIVGAEIQLKIDTGRSGFSLARANMPIGVPSTTTVEDGRAVIRFPATQFANPQQQLKQLLVVAIHPQTGVAVGTRADLIACDPNIVARVHLQRDFSADLPIRLVVETAAPDGLPVAARLSLLGQDDLILGRGRTGEHGKGSMLIQLTPGEHEAILEISAGSEVVLQPLKLRAKARAMITIEPERRTLEDGDALRFEVFSDRARALEIDLSAEGQVLQSFSEIVGPGGRSFEVDSPGGFFGFLNITAAPSILEGEEWAPMVVQRIAVGTRRDLEISIEVEPEITDKARPAQVRAQVRSLGQPAIAAIGLSVVDRAFEALAAGRGIEAADHWFSSTQGMQPLSTRRLQLFASPECLKAPCEEILLNRSSDDAIDDDLEALAEALLMPREVAMRQASSRTLFGNASPVNNLTPMSSRFMHLTLSQADSKRIEIALRIKPAELSVVRVDEILAELDAESELRDAWGRRLWSIEHESLGVIVQSAGLDGDRGSADDQTVWRKRYSYSQRRPLGRLDQVLEHYLRTRRQWPSEIAEIKASWVELFGDEPSEEDLPARSRVVREDYGSSIQVEDDDGRWNLVAQVLSFTIIRQIDRAMDDWLVAGRAFPETEGEIQSFLGANRLDWIAELENPGLPIQVLEPEIVKASVVQSRLGRLELGPDSLAVEARIGLQPQGAAAIGRVVRPFFGKAAEIVSKQASDDGKRRLRLRWTPGFRDPGYLPFGVARHEIEPIDLDVHRGIVELPFNGRWTVELPKLDPLEFTIADGEEVLIEVAPIRWSDSLEVTASLSNISSINSAPAGAEAVVRRQLDPTLAFVVQVITDTQGQALIELPLASAGATWHVEAVATSATGLLAAADGEFPSGGGVEVGLHLPRYATLGDVIELGSWVENRSDRPVRAIVDLEVEGGLELRGVSTTEVLIEPHRHERIAQPAKVTTAGTGIVRVRLRGDVTDVFESTIELQQPGSQLSHRHRRALIGGGQIALDRPDQILPGSRRRLRSIASPGPFLRALAMAEIDRKPRHERHELAVLAALAKRIEPGEEQEFETSMLSVGFPRPKTGHRFRIIYESLSGKDLERITQGAYVSQSDQALIGSMVSQWIEGEPQDLKTRMRLAILAWRIPAYQWQGNGRRVLHRLTAELIEELGADDDPYELGLAAEVAKSYGLDESLLQLGIEIERAIVRHGLTLGLGEFPRPIHQAVATEHSLALARGACLVASLRPRAMGLIGAALVDPDSLPVWWRTTTSLRLAEAIEACTQELDSTPGQWQELEIGRTGEILVLDSSDQSISSVEILDELQVDWQRSKRESPIGSGGLRLAVDWQSTEVAAGGFALCRIRADGGPGNRAGLLLELGLPPGAIIEPGEIPGLVIDEGSSGVKMFVSSYPNGYDSGFIEPKLDREIKIRMTVAGEMQIPPTRLLNAQDRRRWVEVEAPRITVTAR